MSNNGAMAEDSTMSHHGKSVAAVSSVERAGRVMDSSDGGSEGLGLCGGPVLSLVGLGDGLVGDLARTAVDLSRGCSDQASEADEGLQE